MKVKCIGNTGEAIIAYKNRPQGIFKETSWGQLQVGKEYIVMGIILSKGYLKYLVDDYGVTTACPQQLFELTDASLPMNWFFKSLDEKENMFVNVEAIWGYYELCFNTDHYEKLVDMDEDAQLIYYKRKMEMV